jgi:uncharacterized BrkB/YihY/UPF0761 family membrane protein
MTKLLLLLSLLSIIILGSTAVLSPDNPFVWLTTQGLVYQYVRIVLVILLSVLIITTPPRKSWLRVITGFVGLAVAIWTLQQSATYAMQLFDTLGFLGASVALLVTAAERKLPVYSSRPPILAKHVGSTMLMGHHLSHH